MDMSNDIDKKPDKIQETLDRIEKRQITVESSTISNCSFTNGDGGIHDFQSPDFSSR